MRTNYVQDYEKWVKKGRGQGRFSDYQPWITVQDCHSRAVRSRIPSLRLNRQFNCLSNGERLACLALRANVHNF